MSILSALFGKKTDHVADYIAKGAVILDVRTDSEYKSNHIDSAIHIPLAELKNRIKEIKKLNKPVIAHCASGMRSGSAATILQSNGVDAINGGGLSSLQRKLG